MERTGDKLLRPISLQGKLITSVDGALIGENFKALQNMRYTTAHIKGIPGMTKINTAVMNATYFKPRSGFHYLKERIAESHVLVQAYNTGLSASQVLQNTTAIPSAGAFSATALFTDGTGAKIGRFSDAPGGYLAYCNSVESCLYGGDESPIGAYIDYASDASFKYDYTSQLQNSLTDAQNIATIHRLTYVITNLSLLLHLDNNVTDSSANAFTITATGLTYSSTNYKFATHSGIFDGTTTKLSTPDNTAFDLSGGIWTLDFQVYRGSVYTVGQVLPLYYQGTDANNYFSLYINASDQIILSIYAASAEVVNVTTPTYAILPTEWTHVEVVENGNNYYIFINGELKGYTSDAQRPANYTTNPVYIGYDGTHFFLGNLDEIRVLKGTAAHTAAFSPPTHEYSAAGEYVTTLRIGTILPAAGFKFYVETANTTTSTASINYWDGTTWVSVSSLSDGTASGGITLAQDGTMSFTSTASTAKIKIIDELQLYWYEVTLTDCDATTTISQVTAVIPFQTIKEIWDGFYRQVAAVFKYEDSTYYDNTLQVYENIYDPEDKETYLDASGLTSSEYILLGFTEPMMAFKLYYGTSAVNTTASTFMSLYYGGGDGWSSIGNFEDGTSEGNISGAKTGLVSFQPLTTNNEFKQEINNSLPLYYYKIIFNQTLSTTVRIFYIEGIPAPKEIHAHKLPVFGQNRLWLCSDQKEAKNSVLCSAYEQPNVFNGADSIKLYLGDDSAITGGAWLYNQTGDSYYNLMVFFKANETWIVTGDNPNNFSVYKINGEIGCPAPATIKVVNIPTGYIEGLRGTVVVWQGANGIYVSNGSYILPLHFDIQDYFDKNATTHIYTSKIGDSVGDWDENNAEYSWLSASGSSTTLNKELVWSAKKNAWFTVERGTGLYLQYRMKVTDTYGNTYNYGLIETGYMERLEYGTDFDGTDITHTLTFGDLALFNNNPFYETLLRRVKLITLAKTTTTNEISLTHYGNSKTTGTTLNTIAPTHSGYRLMLSDVGEGIGAYTYHGLSLSMITDNETIGFEPVWLGVEYEVKR